NWGWDFDGSYGDWYGGHGIGHTRGRHPAGVFGAGGGGPPSLPPGPRPPRPTRAGAGFGLCTTNPPRLPPNRAGGIAPCPHEWMSDFTYEGIRSYLVGAGLKTQQAGVTADKFLAIGGTADLESNTANLENVYLINQNNTLPLPEPGDWTIALVGASNNDLATY